jgi:hypothetical protein
MIRVAGSAHCSFLFPAELPLAYAYYADIGRVLRHLPHICLAQTYGPDHLRLLYKSTELGIYRIRIFADVETILEDGHVLHVMPIDCLPPVQVGCGAQSTTAHGKFTSQSIFYDRGSQTEIEYALRLQADLPKPGGLRLMPRRVVDSVARSITHTRIREIAAGFVTRSVDAFPQWIEEMRGHGTLPGSGSTLVNSVPMPDCPEENP